MLIKGATVALLPPSAAPPKRAGELPAQNVVSPLAPPTPVLPPEETGFPLGLARPSTLEAPAELPARHRDDGRPPDPEVPADAVPSRRRCEVVVVRVPEAAPPLRRTLVADASLGHDESPLLRVCRLSALLGSGLAPPGEAGRPVEMSGFRPLVRRRLPPAVNGRRTRPGVGVRLPPCQRLRHREEGGGAGCALARRSQHAPPEDAGPPRLPLPPLSGAALSAGPR